MKIDELQAEVDKITGALALFEQDRAEHLKQEQLSRWDGKEAGWKAKAGELEAVCSALRDRLSAAEGRLNRSIAARDMGRKMGVELTDALPEPEPGPTPEAIRAVESGTSYAQPEHVKQAIQAAYQDWSKDVR